MKSTVSERMRARRIELKLTQAAVATVLEVGQETISQWEKDGPSTIKTIERVAYALHCRPAWLAFEVGPKADRH